MPLCTKHDPSLPSLGLLTCFKTHECTSKVESHDDSALGSFEREYEAKTTKVAVQFRMKPSLRIMYASVYGLGMAGHRVAKPAHPLRRRPTSA
jgi:hypothetical protein